VAQTISYSIAQDNSEWLFFNKAGMQFFKKGDLDIAEKNYLEAIQIAEDLDLKGELSASLNNLGLLKIDLLMYKEAKYLLERSLRLRLEVYGTNHRYIAQSYNNLARAYESSEEYNEAINLYIKSLKIYKNLGSKYLLLLARTLNNLSTAQITVGLLDAAEVNLLRALDITKKYSNDNSITFTSMSNLAAVYMSKGNFEQAKELYKNLIIIRRNSHGGDYTKLANVLNNMSVLLKKECYYKEAIVYLEEAIQIWKTNKNIDILKYSSALHNFGELHKALGNRTLAIKYFLKSLSLIEEFDFKISEQYMQQSYALLNIYKDTEEYELAKKQLKKINKYRTKSDLNLITFDDIPEEVYEECSSKKI